MCALNRMADSGRYFLAIVPPESIVARARQLQLELAERFESKASLRSPPHVTLHMPFLWKLKREEELCAGLERHCAMTPSFQVSLDGVGAFPPRVIFINVEATGDLVACQRSLARFCRVTFDIHNSDYGDKPYHPHLTLAFRDLRKAIFPMAWESFHLREFKETFKASHIALLRHTGTEWAILRQMSLKE
jgi:2'-5' RNA ligase